MLRATVVKQRGAFRLDVRLDTQPGTTAVVGESGAGKTTLLRLVAGLDRPDAGRITLGDDVYFDAAAGVSRPAWTRAIGFVAQDYALFPHLTVWDNVAFGLRAQGLARRTVRDQVGATLERLRLTGLENRRPAALSGGQQQRVALARALVLEPVLLLLDEPMSALDVGTRQTIRGELRDLLSRLPCATLYVTHSPLEAMVFGDHIAVIEAGQLTQVGPREDLLRHPRSPYVATLLGVNLFQGSIVERDQSGVARVRTAAGELVVADPGSGGEVFVAVSPQQITLYRERPTGSAQNVFHGPIVELIPEPPAGERVRVALRTSPPLVAEVTKQAVEALGLREGVLVYASFKATGVTAYR